MVVERVAIIERVVIVERVDITGGLLVLGRHLRDSLLSEFFFL